MGEPTFTPGPWNVAGFDSRINGEHYFGIDTPRGQMIVESFGECDFNRKANAALISAAPEMYEALEFSKRKFHDLYFKICCEYIESVLKKARGEE